MSNEYSYSTSYGKLRVPVYRVYARPLLGVKPIPESQYSGSKNILFAYEIDVEVLGENFCLRIRKAIIRTWWLRIV